MAIPATILQISTLEKPVYQWPEPEPLIEQGTSTPYPLNALPGIIGGAVREVIHIVKCPAALAANSALAVLATACQGIANVQPHAGLEASPLSLNLLVISDSGERKTSSDKKFTKALKDWCAAKTTGLEQNAREYKAALASWNAEKRGLEKSIEASRSKDTPENMAKAASAKESLTYLEQHEPEKVFIPDMVNNRATPQAIIDALRDWPGVGILTAEAGSFFGGNGMKPENLMNNLALLNEAWDGADITDRTRTNGKISLTGIRLTVGLAVQEAVIRDFYEKSGKTTRGSGFFARFLLAWPESTIGTRFITFEEARATKKDSTSQLNLFHAKLHNILEQQYNNGKSGKFDTLPVLQLSDDALSHWVNYFNSVELETQTGGEMEEARDIASKSADNAARLAGLFHLFNGGDVLDQISGETMVAACRLASWHLYEARRFFFEIALPVDDLEAAKLNNWLITHCRKANTNSVGRSYVLQHSNLRKAGKLNKALDTLERANRVRQTKEGRTAILEINPALLEEVM